MKVTPACLQAAAADGEGEEGGGPAAPVLLCQVPAGVPSHRWAPGETLKWTTKKI